MAGCVPAPAQPGRLSADPPRLEFRVRATDPDRTIEPVKAVFLLRNLGDRPVRVLNIEKSCGCANPILQQDRIEAHEASQLELVIDPPLVGERNVDLMVSTDSPVTPRLSLRAQIITERPPPFLVSVQGNLAFRSSSNYREGLPFSVVTIQLPGDPTEPRVTLDIDDGRVSLLSKVDTPPIPGIGWNGAVQRRWSYSLAFPAEPPGEYRSGRVEVYDPWNPSHPLQSLGVFLQPASDLQVVPERLMLGTQQNEARIFARHSSEEFTIEASLPESVPLELVKQKSIKGGYQEFLLRRSRSSTKFAGVVLIELIARRDNEVVRKSVEARVLEGPTQ